MTNTFPDSSARINYFFIGLIFIYCASCISPTFGARISTLLSLLLLAISLCVILIKDTSRSVKRSGVVVSVFGISTVILLYKILGISSAELGNMYHQIAFFQIALIGFFIHSYLTIKQKLVLFALLSIVLIADICNNIYLYSMFSHLYGIDMDAAAYVMEDEVTIGGTPFNTTSFFAFAAFYFIFLNVKDKVVRYATLGLALIAMYYMFFCGARGTVVLLDIFIIIMLPLLKLQEKSSVGKLFTYTFYIIMLLALLIGTDAILDFMISISPDRLGARFLDLKQTSQQGVTESSFSGRFGLYEVSINSFLSNISSFFFGIGDHRGSISGVTSYAEMGIGGHSEMLDNLARFGILGAFFVIPFYKWGYRWYINEFGNRILRKQVQCIFVAFILCSFIKAVFLPTVGCVIFVFLPLAFDFVNYKSNYNN